MVCADTNHREGDAATGAAKSNIIFFSTTMENRPNKQK